MGTFRIKRVYEQPARSDGYRILVDRLWPRGVRKEAARLDEWRKDLAPSTELRERWHRDPAEHDLFVERYRHELDVDDADAVASALDLAAAHPVITLVYAAKDPMRNHARVLADHLNAALAEREAADASDASEAHGPRTARGAS